jgi:hypothetical protein
VIPPLNVDTARTLVAVEAGFAEIVPALEMPPAKFWTLSMMIVVRLEFVEVMVPPPALRCRQKTYQGY